MMAALQAGGMTLAYSARREARLEDHMMPQASGFNPGGIWELERSQLLEPSFPAVHEGKAIKLVWDWLKFLKPYEPGYQVISMMRHPEEVHQSFSATVNVDRVQIRHTYMDRLNQVNNMLAERDDVDDLMVVDYVGCLDNPNATFEHIASAGWPINWEAAAEIPDRSLYRFRVGETITEGA